MEQSGWKSGLKYIQKGCDHFEAGDKIRAGNCFEFGIEKCLNALSKMKESDRKFEKRQQISKYIDILESIRYNTDPPSSFLQSDSIESKTQFSKKQKPVFLKGKKPEPQNSFDGKKLTKDDIEMMEKIHNEIVSFDTNISFKDVIGLDNVKQVLNESVILPMQRPDLYTGLLAPPKGVLMFGPPGNGKTFVAKALASECKATFFNVSAASLTCKYVGESEKMVRSLFMLARERSPSVIFIDEIDSLLTSRGSNNENEASRRIKTEFMVQIDGVASHNDEKPVLIIGATNLPWELDDAILRRLPKKVMVPKPNAENRRFLIDYNLKKHKNVTHNLKKKDIERIVSLTEGYSASDLHQVVVDAAMGTLRELSGEEILKIKQSPPIQMHHFTEAIKAIKPSTDEKGMARFSEWNQQFGSTIVVKNKKNYKEESKEEKVDIKKQGSSKGRKSKKSKNLLASFF